jgi:CheY-like chemotaxis protein
MLERAHAARLIYVLEDDSAQLALICDYLESLHYVVRGFSDGEELLIAVRTQTPDILVTDYTLREGISGEVCARLVRRLAPAAHIIVLSGQSRPAESIADHWIEKGASALSELRRLLERL